MNDKGDVSYVQCWFFLQTDVGLMVYDAGNDCEDAGDLFFFLSKKIKSRSCCEVFLHVLCQRGTFMFITNFDPLEGQKLKYMVATGQMQTITVSY